MKELLICQKRSLYGWSTGKPGQSGSIEPAIFFRGKDKTFGAWGDQQSPLVFGHRPETAPILTWMGQDK